jgi:ribonucleoside-diphosphate reductase alpha chain
MGEKIMAFISDAGRSASRELAKQRGAFPLFGESVYANGEGIRNATVTTIAPTGTLSIIAGCSSGVEPVFAYAYVRNVMDGTELVETNPILKKTLERRGLYSEELMRKIIERGSLTHIEEIPMDIRRVFVCSHDISPEYHVRMQAAFQRHCDNAVSKTVNFTNGAAPEDVEETYKLAYKLGCKGITIYRDGSRESQVLNIGKVNNNAAPEAAPPQTVRPRPRPESMMGLTKRVAIGCGNLYITVNYDEHGICEVFTSTGKAGGCPSQSEATARLTSIALRSGIDIDYVIKQMRGIRCPSTIRQAGMKCTSCPDAIARAIKEVDDILKTGQFALPGVFVPGVGNASPESYGGALCPECGKTLEHGGGCVSCRNCGYSKCN